MSWVSDHIERPHYLVWEMINMWVFPKIGVPQNSQNGWFIMEIPIKLDDLGVPLFSETSTCNFTDFFPFGYILVYLIAVYHPPKNKERMTMEMSNHE